MLTLHGAEGEQWTLSSNVAGSHEDYSTSENKTFLNPAISKYDGNPLETMRTELRGFVKAKCFSWPNISDLYSVVQ